MTKKRIYGEDKDFMAWVRAHPDLPSYSVNHGRTVNDVDFLIHQYMTTVDAMGSREIQQIMHIETKSRGGVPDFAQVDTLFKEHLMKVGKKKINQQQVRHYGVSVLSMSGTSPENSDHLRWGRFRIKGVLRFRIIRTQTLVDLLTFRIDPDTLKPIDYRRHHKTRVVERIEQTPLGFEMTVHETLRS